MTADLALLGKSSATETVIENRIFIGGIPPHADETDFRNFLTSTFDKYMIKDVKIIFDRTGASKGYGFITFDSKDVAQKILNSSEYENLLYKERKLNISKAVKKNTYPKGHISPANVMQNSGQVQYVLLQGQDGLPLGYTQSMLQLQQYGAYGAPAFYLPPQSPYPYAITNPVAGGGQNGLGAGGSGVGASTAALVSQSSPHIQYQTIPWSAAAAAAAAAAASLPGNQLQFLNHSAAAAAPGAMACFGGGAAGPARSAGAGELLYYAPGSVAAAAFNNSLTTSDYSSCSDPNSMDPGTDSESSPARGIAAGDCFSPGLMPYSPAGQPQLYHQYAQVKGGHQPPPPHAMPCLQQQQPPQQQQPQQQQRLMVAAGGAAVGGRGDGRRSLNYMDHGGHGN